MLKTVEKPAASQLKEWLEGRDPSPEEITSKATHILLTQWEDALKKEDLAGLLLFILEGMNLSPTEIKGFLRALPPPILRRVLNSVVGKANGLHALVSLEICYRLEGTTDYTLHQTDEKQLYVVVPHKDEEITLWLDDHFTLNL